MSAAVTLRLKASSIPKDLKIDCDLVQEIKIDKKSPSVTLGRSEVTGIQDKRCSRDHISISLDNDSDELVIQQNGANPGCVQLKGSDESLTKRAVKRIPLDAKAKLPPLTVYMIHKDHLYGYEVVIKKLSDTESQEKPTSQHASELNETRGKGKRKGDSTLDNFFQVKKPKTEGKITEGNSLIGSLLFKHKISTQV